jgi:hypothetical protein
MHPLRNDLQSKLVALSLALMLMLLWLVSHGYQGLGGDAQIYAFQALARIHPALSADLYLQNTSQDRYTLFSPFYASLIGWIGLEGAARLLTLFFAAWFIAAAWNFAAAITQRGVAWLAVAFLIIAAGNYGAAGVFRIFEPYLTARLPAQALIITAFACYVRGNKAVGVLIAIGALFVHPLMALPGLLFLIFMSLPGRLSVVVALGGIFAALGIAMLATTLPSVANVFTLIDADWLDVVKERSQFLFPQLWSAHDWDINVRPLIYLIFIAAVCEETRIRRICNAALLLGACGLAVAMIAGLTGPVAVLLQGQAWRWVWIAAFVSVLLLPATILSIWRERTCGPLCAVLLIGGWLVSDFAGTACVLLALIGWLMRKHIAERATIYCGWMALLGAIALLIWVIGSSWGLGFTGVEGIASNPAVNFSAALLFTLLWWWLRASQSLRVPLMVCTVLLIASIAVFPASFKQARILGSDSDIHEFSDWSQTIPPSSTVLVAPTRDVGSFVWFTLMRPNYLALDQSAGVVFSRQTALEIRRRSELLQPLSDPSWKILSQIRRGAGKQPNAATTRALTLQTLIHVCGDPALGFVISPENIGFDPLRHTYEGAWKDWNLYDCTRVRSQPAT